MKRYSNIPIKERIRNANRCYQHEVKLEEIAMRKLIKDKETTKNATSDKEQQEAEAFALLQSLEKGGEE